MLILIPFIGVGIPLMVIGFYALYRANKEERKEQMQAQAGGNVAGVTVTEVTS